MEEEKARKGEAPARIRHAPCLTPSHPSSSACLPATTAGGKNCSLCGPSLIAGRNPRQAGPVVSRGQCAGSASAAHADEACSEVGAGTGIAGRASKERLARRRAEACSQRAAAPKGLLLRPREHRPLHTRTRTQARSLTHARTQPRGAAPGSPLICEEGNKGARSSSSSSGGGCWQDALRKIEQGEISGLLPCLAWSPSCKRSGGREREENEQPLRAWEDGGETFVQRAEGSGAARADVHVGYPPERAG